MARRLAPDRARQFAATSNRHFQFNKRSQLFIRTHNETLSIVAMHISNEDSCAMTQNFVAPGHDSDTIRTNIRNDSERSLATWQWRAKVPLIGNESFRRCVVRKLTE